MFRQVWNLNPHVTSYPNELCNTQPANFVQHGCLFLLQEGLPFVNLIDAVVLFYSIIGHDPFKVPPAFITPNVQISIWSNRTDQCESASLNQNHTV